MRIRMCEMSKLKGILNLECEGSEEKWIGNVEGVVKCFYLKIEHTIVVILEYSELSGVAVEYGMPLKNG